MLSVPSTTRPTPARTDSMFAAWTSFETPSIITDEFTARSFRAATSAFGRSTSVSSKRTCRCRFVSSTTSRSTSLRWPTPARASSPALTVPRAPRPIIATVAAESFRWPSGPISGRIVWRMYRSAATMGHGTDAHLMAFCGLPRKHVVDLEPVPQVRDARPNVVPLRRPKDEVRELAHLDLLRTHPRELVGPDPGDGVHDDVVLLEGDGPVVRVRVPPLHHAGFEEMDLVALRVPAVGELDRKVALLELAPEGLRVPNDLLRVRLTERLRLEERLCRRGNPVPVRVVRHPPREALEQPGKEVLTV